MEEQPPKLDWTETPKNPNSTINIGFSSTSEIPQRELLTKAEIVEEQAQRLATILKLEDEEVKIVLTKLPKNVSGQYDSQSKIILINEKIKGLKLISTLAHEFYHARQHIHFPTFYQNHKKHYLTRKDNPDLYEKQLIEIGARAFAQRYIEHLQENPDQIGNEDLRKAIEGSKKRKFWRKK